MNSLILIQLHTRLLTSKLLKPSGSYIVLRNGEMWKRYFSAPQNVKKENQMKHKYQVRTKFILTGLWVWRIILVNKGWAHKRQKFTLISIKIMRIWKIFFTRNRVFKRKEFVSNLHVRSNGLRKIWAIYIFHFSTRILNSTHIRKCLIFFSQNICRKCPTIQFRLSTMSKLLAKNISNKVSLKITIRKRHVYIDIRWPWIWTQYFQLVYLKW